MAMLFELVDSFVFASQTGIHTIVRTGWMSTPPHCKKIFAWKRFHRVYDIIRRIFDGQGLGFKNTVQCGDDVVRRMLFESVHAQMVHMILQYRGVGIAGISPLEYNFLMPFTDAYLSVDAAVIVDDETMQWIFDLLRGVPAFFGAHVTEAVCRTRINQIKTDASLQFMTEDLLLDGYLRQYYRAECAPLSVDIASELSGIAKTSFPAKTAGRDSTMVQSSNASNSVRRAALRAKLRAQKRQDSSKAKPYAPMYLKSQQ